MKLKPPMKQILNKISQPNVIKDIETFQIQVNKTQMTQNIHENGK